MDLKQMPAQDHATVRMQEQLQQMKFLPLNPASQTSVAHVMPTPTRNWSMEAMPWKITKTDHTGNVMEFTAHAAHKNNATRRALLHQKRKTDFNAIGTLPVKQYITEEKITAHFNGLHISSDYIQHSSANTTDSNGDEIPTTSGKCFSNLTYEDYQITAKELEQKLRNANRITVCDELKKFNDEQKKVSYLPEALLHRIHKPCTALVLWQPSPISSIFNQENINNSNTKKDASEHQQNETIDDIDDFIDNNNTCNLDFNNVKPESMDEDL